MTDAEAIDALRALTDAAMAVVRSGPREAKAIRAWSRALIAQCDYYLASDSRFDEIAADLVRK